jgi:hypothetical protein
MIQYISVIFLLQLYFRHSLSTFVSNYLTKSNITDDVFFSEVVNDYILSPLYPDASMKGQDVNYDTLELKETIVDITNLILSISKLKLEGKRFLSFTATVHFALFLMTTSTTEKVLYGMLSPDSFRVPYYSFPKKFCKTIIGSIVSSFGLHVGQLSQIAWADRCSEIMDDGENNPDALMYRNMISGTVLQVYTDLFN